MNWDQYYLDMCKAVATNSKCLSRKIGAIIVKDKSIVSTGYNGPPRGVPTCNSRWNGQLKDDYLLEVAKDIEIDCPKDKTLPEYMETTCPRRVLGFKSGEGLNICCLHGDTKIKLLDGTLKTIEELSKLDKDQWIYATDTNTMEIVPAKAINIRMTGIRKDLVEVKLDDGVSFKVTEDHLILLKDGSYKEAGKLIKDDRLNPIYYNIYDGYENISNIGRLVENNINSETSSINTEDLVYFFFNEQIKLGNEYVIHHKDNNKRNNVLNNLELMTRSKHSSLHIKQRDKEFFIKGGKYSINKRKENLEKFIKDSSLGGTTSMTKNWQDSKFRNKMKDIQINNGKITANKTNSDPDIIYKRTKGRVLKKIIKLIDSLKSEEINDNNYEEIVNKLNINIGKGYGYPSKEIVLKYFNSIDDVISLAKVNHRVTSVIPLDIEVPVYDLEVPQYHNFAIDLGNNSCIFVHNCAGHAERNALINAARHGIAIKDAILYLDTVIPCKDCMIEIGNSGIKEVVCTGLEVYDKQAEYLIKHSDIIVRKYEL